MTRRGSRRLLLLLLPTHCPASVTYNAAGLASSLTAFTGSLYHLTGSAGYGDANEPGVSAVEDFSNDRDGSHAVLVARTATFPTGVGGYTSASCVCVLTYTHA